MKRQALVYQNIMQRLKDALPMAGPSLGRKPLMPQVSQPYPPRTNIPPNKRATPAMKCHFWGGRLIRQNAAIMLRERNSPQG